MRTDRHARIKRENDNAKQKETKRTDKIKKGWKKEDFMLVLSGQR